MLPEEYIGNCAKSMCWKAQTSGMSMHLLMSWIMMKYWDLTMYRQKDSGRPDIILVKKATWKLTISDIAVPSDNV